MDRRTGIAVSMTTFRPDPDGFAFRNAFAFDQSERDRMRRLLRVPGLPRAAEAYLPDSFGLCAGMSFAAVDYFHSHLALPRGDGPDDLPTSATPQGAALRSLLWDRQIHSLATDGRTYARWTYSLHLVPRILGGGHPHLQRGTRRQWPRLKRELDAGRPWPIGLVGDTRNPFNHHAVVAYGYEDTGPDRGTVFIYDPNWPGEGNTIAFAFGSRMLAATESRPSRRRGRLAGFFCYQYAPLPGWRPDAGVASGSPDRG